jgi:hypothetical protein
MIDTYNRKVAPTILILVILLLGCIPISSARHYVSIPLKTSEKAAPNTEGVWTIMTYLDGDNDLGKYAYDDLQEMMSVGSTKDVNIVVLYDTYDQSANSSLIVQNGAKLIKEYGEVDMGNAQTLYTFIEDTMNMYPADHYLLNIWDHGDDFLGACKDFHGTTVPVGGHSFLEHKDLVPVLDLFKNTKVGKLDVLTFDACIESMIEVAYDYKDAANYLVVSEDYVTYWGFPYNTILADLVANPTMEAQELSRIFVNYYMNEYLKDNGTGGGGYTMAFVAMTAINLSKPGYINDFVRNLGVITGYLSTNMKANKNIISSARAHAVMNYPITGWDADIDLYTFIAEIDSKIHDTGVHEAAKFIKDSFGDNVDAFIFSRSSHQYDVKSSHGLGIYFPTSRGSLIHNTMTDAAYYFGGNVPFASATSNWGTFLRTYFDYWL